MGDFRVSPVAVPDDWYMQMLELQAKVDQQYRDLRLKLGKEEGARKAKEESIVLLLDDVLAYFETVLATPEVLSSKKLLAQHWEKDLAGPDPDPDLVALNGGFLNWWIFSRFSVNYLSAGKLRRLYTLATFDAFNYYLSKSDIEGAYKFLLSGARENGITVTVTETIPF